MTEYEFTDFQSFKQPEVVDAFFSLHDKYVVVSADKAENIIIFIFKILIWYASQNSITSNLRIQD